MRNDVVRVVRSKTCSLSCDLEPSANSFERAASRSGKSKSLDVLNGEWMLGDLPNSLSWWHSVAYKPLCG